MVINDWITGYSYVGSDVVAIARLRGKGLQTLLIPEDCLEPEEPNDQLTHEDLHNISEVSNSFF